VAIEAPAPAAKASASGPSGAKKAGPRVSFDRKSADVRALLVALGEVGHMNVVLSDAVGGAVTMKVEHLPWDEALKAVLAARHLEMEAHGNVIRIGTAEEFEADHRAERERAEALW
jgi:type IV pilus assembly protein PilQ